MPAKTPGTLVPLLRIWWWVVSSGGIDRYVEVNVLVMFTVVAATEMPRLGNPAAFGFLITASMVTLLMATFTWPQRSTYRHGGIVTVFLLSVALIFAAYGFSFSSALSFEQQVLAIRLTYIGWLIAPVAVLFFFSWITGRDRWMRPWVVTFVIVVQLFFATIVFGPWAMELFFGGGFAPGTFAFPRNSPLYIAFYAWTYALLTTSVIVTIVSALRSSRLHRMQVMLVLVTILLPWVMSSLSFFNFRILGIGPAVLSLVPIAFTVFAVANFRSFDLRPMNQAESYLASETGVVVLDDRGRITAMNPSAVRLLGPGRSPAMGLEVEEVWSDRPAIVAALRGGHVDDLTILSDQGDARLRFESSPLALSRGRRGGVLIVIRPEPVEADVHG
jgi:PAS domain-containing protein